MRSTDVRVDDVNEAVLLKSLMPAEFEYVAQSQAKVLITGASGSDKSAIARLVHSMGRRATRPFVAVNCAGVSDERLEVLLFGEIRDNGPAGTSEATGLLEKAANGTMFLDEVDQLGARMQKALTRFLATGEIRRAGSSQVRSRVDVRFITATSGDLYARVEAQAFREDLYYRLNVIRLEIPSLQRPPALPC
jgi:DNA-binding NtrC family response regulator